jgi:hypothetical protein
MKALLVRIAFITLVLVRVSRRNARGTCIRTQEDSCR